MPSLIDLHIHSKFSDGQFDIKQLVELSRANGVGLISITDHDDIRSSLELKNNSDIKERMELFDREVNITRDRFSKLEVID